MTIFRKKEIGWGIVFILVVCYAQYFNNSFVFDPEYSVYTDSVNLYPLHRLADPGLFCKDPLAGKAVENAGLFNPGLSFVSVYSFLLHFLSLQTATKLVSIVVSAFSIFLIYRWALQLVSFSGALFFSASFVFYFLSMDSFFGGGGRVFGILFYICFIFFLSRERLLLALGCLLCAGFFYMSIVPGMVLTYFFMFLCMKRGHSLWKRDALYAGLFVSVVGALGVILWRNQFVANIFMNLKEVQTYKLYQKVVTPVQLGDPVAVVLVYIFNIYEHSVLYTWVTSALLAVSAVILLTVKEWWRLPKLIWCMVLGSFLGFCIIFPLHPTAASRQFVFVVPIFLVAFITLNICKQLRGRDQFLESGCGIILGVFLVAHPFFNDMPSWRANKPVYDYIRLLPKDVLIAGSTKSRLLRSVPFFTKRTVYYSEKIRDFWIMFFPAEYIRDRRQAVISALYAHSLGSVKAFIRDSGTDYFVVETMYYDAVNNAELFLTGNSDEVQVYDYIHERLADGHFALLDFSSVNYDHKLEIQGNTVYIISADKILKASDPLVAM